MAFSLIARVGVMDIVCSLVLSIDTIPAGEWTGMTSALKMYLILTPKIRSCVGLIVVENWLPRNQYCI